MPTGNINVDHIDINSLSDTPLNQIKPVEDLPTEGTVSSPTGDQDISNAPLQISSSKRISLKTLAQYFDHILSQNNNLKDLKLDGYNINTSFNKLIHEISNGEITHISQILGDPKMTNSIWLFLVKTIYDLSKAQLNSFKNYTGFPESIDSFPFTENNLTDILNNLQKYICSKSMLGLDISTMFFTNKLWPLDNGKGLTPPYPSNIWERITSLSERIYYLYKWAFSVVNPYTVVNPTWENPIKISEDKLVSKSLYDRIVDLENAVGSGQGNDLTTRVSNLENKLLLLYKNSLAKRNEVLIYPDPDPDPLTMPSISPFTLKGGTDYQITALMDHTGIEPISYPLIPSELIIDFNDFLYENPLDSEDNINISQLSSDNITPLDPNKATVLFEIDHLIPFISDINVNVNVSKSESESESSNESSITNSLSKSSKDTVLPPWPDPEPDPTPVVKGNRVNYILGNGLNDITLTLNNKPDKLRVLIHEPIVNGGLVPHDVNSSSYANTLFGNLDNDYTNLDSSTGRNGLGYFKLEFIYNPPKSIPGAEEGYDYYTHPTLEVNVYIKLSFNPPSKTPSEEPQS